MEQIAFIGSTRNEQNSVYLGTNGNAQRISTREIDDILENYTEAQLAKVKLESRNDRSSHLLYIHLPDRTIVFDLLGTQALGQPIWFELTSSYQGYAEYRARHLIYCYNAWQVADTQSAKIGVYTDDIGTHWGDKVGWIVTGKLLVNSNHIG